MTTDCLIAGGGIGGSVLGHLLARGGKKVIVLERSLAPPPWTRPELLWPHTVDFLFTLRPRSDWEQDAMLPLQGLEVLDENGAFSPILTPALIAETRIQPWSTDPHATRESLLATGSFELHRGVEVTEVLVENERILGLRTRDRNGGTEREWLSRWTIGDDGARSLVRKACGIEMKTRRFPIEFFCFRFAWPQDFPAASGRICPNRRWRESGILALGALPLPNGQGAGLVPVLSREFNACSDIETRWREFCAVDPRIGEVVGERRFPEDFVRIRRDWGHARRYGNAGAFLLGDAAHPVSPAGGQGANMSVADARVLAELILQGSTGALSEYEGRRRTANSRSLRFTRLASFGSSMAPSLTRIASLFRVLDGVRRRPAAIRALLHMASTAFLEKEYRRRDDPTG